MNIKEVSDRLCMGCMMPKPTDGKCVYCSYEDTSMQLKPYLPVKSVVAGSYIVGKVLYTTGESTTYIGWDYKSSSAVFITEFLPDTLCVRLDNNELQVITGMENEFNLAYNEFLDLYRNLAKLRELSAISPVYDIVEDCGTVYAISEYEQSVSLRDFLMKCPGGYLSWDEARKLFMPMLSTIEELHLFGVYHGGITPNTLRVCRDGRMRIFGFATKNARMAGTVLNASLSSGYSAIEQYTGERELGAQTDIYAICACIYRSIVGSSPASAQERLVNDRLLIPAKINEGLPVFVVNALSKGLRIDPDERLGSINELREELSGSPVVSITSDLTEDLIPDEEPKHIKSVTVKTKKKKSSKKAVIVTICIMLVIFVAVLVALGVYTGRFDGLLQQWGLVSGETVTLEYTTSADMVIVPDFVKNKATKESCQSNKLWNEDYYIVFDEGKSLDVAEGYVCAQSIEPGTSVNKGSKIVLSICTGKPNMVLDDVTGLKKEAAVKQLEKNGFKVSVVEVENDGSHTQGEISQMSKIAGVEYPYGTEVMLSVWSKPVTTSVTDSADGE